MFDFIHIHNVVYFLHRLCKSMSYFAFSQVMYKQYIRHKKTSSGDNELPCKKRLGILNYAGRFSPDIDKTLKFSFVYSWWSWFYFQFEHLWYFWLQDTGFIGPAVRVFANGPGDLGSIPGRVIPKTLKMELDTTLLNTQHYKVRFKGKVEQSREWSSALPYTLV